VTEKKKDIKEVHNYSITILVNNLFVHSEFEKKINLNKKYFIIFNNFKIKNNHTFLQYFT